MAATITAAPLLGFLVALAGCTASVHEPEPAPGAAATSRNPSDRAYVGWYLQQGNGEYFFQACGESTRYRVDSGELRSRASDFGLGTDNPVYVRLRGRLTPKDSVLLVSRVEAFGSSTPVRDCPMTGLVIAAPG